MRRFNLTLAERILPRDANALGSPLSHGILQGKARLIRAMAGR
jgi:hypothetical protein